MFTIQPIRIVMLLTAVVAAGCWSRTCHGQSASLSSAVAPAAESDASEAPKNADDNPHLWKPKTRAVAVFKNGLGFFMREGEVKLRDGWCTAQKIPPAAFGTLAIYARDPQQTVDIVGSGPGEIVEFDGRDAPKDLAAKRTRLEASKNLKVQLQYDQKGQKRTAAGRLLSVGPEFVVLETEANSFAVPTAGVTRLQILELPLRIHVAGDPAKTAAKGPAASTLGMAYLRQGITWIPEYTLKVLDDDNAELTLRGTLVNEAEDLVHTDVHLVVGVPHFVHTQYMAPIAVGQIIRTIGASVPSAVMTQVMNRAALVQNDNGAPQFGQNGSIVERPASSDSGDLGRALGNLPQMDSAAATDYTVYTKTDLTLRRGEKAILTLFVKKIKYSHIYRWSPPTAMEHSLVLRNQTDSAWTTGPCLALSDDRPLSEDLLKYTPKGGRGELPVTAAINIAHDKSEREIDRKLRAYSPSHNINFDLVTLEGKLRLRNYEKRTVEVVVNNPIAGKPGTASHNGVTSIDSDRLRLLDRQGTVCWTIHLKPGEEQTLTYQYERYVPSN